MNVNEFRIPTTEEFWLWVEHWRELLGTLSRFDIGLHWFALGTIFLVASLIFGRRREKIYVDEGDYDDDNFAPDDDEDEEVLHRPPT